MGPLGLADTGSGWRHWVCVEVESVRRWPCQEKKLSVVPPRPAGNESLEDAILDIAAACREDVKPCVLVEKPASRRSR
jgi:hypothetical protein